MDNGEIWRDIPGYEGRYQASSFGRVRSLPRVVRHSRGGPKCIHGRVLTQHKSPNGYLRVIVYRDGKDAFLGVHRLVLAAFSGTWGEQANHKNGNKSDNRPDNLEWATSLQNMAHAVDTGLCDLKGEKHNRARLTNAQVQAIRQLLAKHVRQRDIAASYGVSRSTVTAINRGVNWRFLELPEDVKQHQSENHDNG